MPYIPKERRKELDGLIEGLSEELRKTDSVGDYNYTISLLLHKMIIGRGRLRYQTVNDIIGILGGVKTELNENIFIPYEKIKRSENGPVSELDASLKKRHG